MNNANTQQPKRSGGVVRYLLAMAALGNIGAGKMANELLVNGYRSPMPGRYMNQRQKRKLIRQQPHGRNN